MDETTEAGDEVASMRPRLIAVDDGYFTRDEA